MTSLDTSQITLDFAAAPLAEARWKLRSFLRRESSIKRVRGCGSPLGHAVAVKELVTGERALGGVESCASAWACPVCAAKISAHRLEELRTMLIEAEKKDFQILFLTLTLQHKKEDSLKDNLDILNRAWSRFTGGKQIYKEPLGYKGFVKVLEITHGENGWHPHIHALFFCEKRENYIETRQGSRRLERFLFELWQKKVRKLGAECVPTATHIEWITVTESFGNLSSYFNKQSGIDKEITLGVFKRGKRGSFTPFQLLALASEGDADALDLWHEYEQVTRGRRMISRTPSLVKELGVNEDLSDEDIINQKTEATELFFIARKDWRNLLESGIGARLTGAYDVFGMRKALAKMGISTYDTIEEVPIEYAPYHKKE